MGLKILEDVRIVGFDGIDETKRFHPTLTTVQQFSDKKGYQAAKMFLNQDNDSVILPYEVIPGEST